MNFLQSLEFVRIQNLDLKKRNKKHFCVNTTVQFYSNKKLGNKSNISTDFPYGWNLYISHILLGHGGAELWLTD